jgi:hypothetical protein
MTTTRSAQARLSAMAIVAQSWRSVWRSPARLWPLAALGALCWQLGAQAMTTMAVHLLGLAYGEGLLAPLFEAARQAHQAAGAMLWMLLRDGGILEASTYPIPHQMGALLGDVGFLVLLSWLVLMSLIYLVSRLIGRQFPGPLAARIAAWYVAGTALGMLCLLLPGLLFMVVALPAVAMVGSEASGAVDVWREGLSLGWRHLGALSVLAGVILGMPVAVDLLVAAMALLWPLGAGAGVILWFARMVALLWLAQGLVRFMVSCQEASSSSRKERKVAAVAGTSNRKPV